MNILENLPGDLPEAFDQALGRISDTRYGTRIFALVAAAVFPLTGDQLKVALTVEPGNATWEFWKLPQDAKQLVDCCGGSLIEMDEEDGKVRFIHHSVFAHLETSQSPHNSLGLSWVEEAEQALGLVCTTYLSYGIFDTRITATEKIDANRVVQESQDAAKASSPVLAHFIKHIKNGKQRKQIPTQLNVLSVLHQIRFEREDDPLKCFLPYARKHWLHHTRFLHADATKKEYLQWQIILEEKSQIVATPWVWTSSSWSNLLIYAAESSHCCLFQYVLRGRLEFRNLTDFSTVVTLLTRNGLKIKGPWLDDILARYIAGSEHPETKVLIPLLQLGASPDFSLDYDFYTDMGKPQLSKVARHLCNAESALHGARLGLPLLRRILDIFADSQEDMMKCVSPAICSGWDAAIAEFLRYPHHLRLTGTVKDRQCLQRAIEEEQLVIARLLVESGTRADDSLRLLARFRGSRAVCQVEPTFNMKPRDRSIRESIKSKFPDPPTFELPHYSKLKRNPDSAVNAIIRDANKKGLLKRPTNLISAILWIIENTCYHSLTCLLEELDYGHLHDLGIPDGGLDPLLLALEAYRPRIGSWYRSEMLDIVTILISRSKIIRGLDYHNEHGYSPLHYAVTWSLEYDHYNPAERLLQEGANPNIVSHQKHTPLEIVLSSDLTPDGLAFDNFSLTMNEVIHQVGILLKHGADPNLECANGLLPLHFAAARGHLKLVGLLLAAGALDFTLSELHDNIRKPMEMACLICSVEGWKDDEFPEWGRLARKAKTLSDWHNIWRRKNSMTIGSIEPDMITWDGL